jgi:hypothetical protein
MGITPQTKVHVGQSELQFEFGHRTKYHARIQQVYEPPRPLQCICAFFILTIP